MKLKSEIGEVFNGSFEVALHIGVLRNTSWSRIALITENFAFFKEQ